MGMHIVFVETCQTFHEIKTYDDQTVIAIIARHRAASNEKESVANFSYAMPLLYFNAKSLL